MSVESNTVLELQQISKSFPGVKALDNVSLKVEKNQVLALIGENGAGKSTLIKIITGVYIADEGEISLFGKKVKFTSPVDAFDAGISVVHQERNLIDTFSVTENIFIGEITRNALKKINMKPLYEEAKKYLDMVGLKVSPRDSLVSMKAGQKQLLEIARALSQNSKIILLDEPTASTSIKESEELLEIVDSLRTRGFSFIYVSHKLEEVFKIADKLCVLRDGKNAGPISSRNEIDKDAIIVQMIGRTERTSNFPIRDKSGEPVKLEAKEIVSRNNRKPCSFKLHKSAILGWYGLVGAGRTEIARELIGLDPVTGGGVEIDDQNVRIKHTRESIDAYKISYISEDRNQEGLFLMHDIKTNISASIWEKESGFLGILRSEDERSTAEEYVKKVDIKTPGIEQLVVNLSGGNRQKVSISKGLVAKPEIIIFDEPTVGIDIRTKDDIHDMIFALAESGISIILISSDLNEMIKIADTICVFNDGVICAELPNTKKYDEMSQKIMRIILGEEEKIA